MINPEIITTYENKQFAIGQIKHHAWHVVLNALEEDFETYKDTLTPNEIAEAFIEGVVHKALALATTENKALTLAIIENKENETK